MFTPISLGDFRARTGISNGELVRDWNVADRVTSLRDLKTIVDIRAMPRVYLKRLVESVPLAGDASVLPYKDCRIHTACMDPNRLMVGQTFIEREKCRSFLEEFEDVLGSYCINRGMAKRTPIIAFGEDGDGALAIAHYLPPIVEVHEADCLLDGVHRNYLVKKVGTTLESIIVERVAQPFPCAVGEWERVLPVDDKPPKSERFHNLEPSLFRDLKFIGIDG